jgi:hypothetical protein
MSDPLRDDLQPAPSCDAADRNTKIEQLLLIGLDHYFSAQYEQAVHVWTRVLFLDRGHARARAYIERARSAVGERQREVEEQLHSGVAAFNRGDADEARRLLTSAVARGGPNETALSYLERLDRLQVAGGSAEGARPGSPAPARDRTGRAMLPRSQRGLLLPVLLLSVVACAAVYVVDSWDRLQGVVLRRQAVAVAPGPAHAEPLPVPTSSELALARARALFDRGRLRDSLRVLERVQLGDPARADADALRGRIQRELIAAADARSNAATPLTERAAVQRPRE